MHGSGGGVLNCRKFAKKPKRLKCYSSQNPPQNEQPLLSELTKGVRIYWVREKELLPCVSVFIVFWAIFYQQNSTWVFQGTMMDCKVGSVNEPPCRCVCVCAVCVWVHNMYMNICLPT